MKIKQVLMGALMTFGVVEGLAGGAAAQAATTSAAAASAAAAPVVSHHYVQVDDVKVFYREAGNPSAPTILLLHGFPTSSFMYRELIPRLADRYHVIAPDLPGFGFTQSPDCAHYAYIFDHLAQTIDHFTETGVVA